MKLSLVLKSIVISNIKIFFGKCIIKQGGAYSCKNSNKE